MKKTALAILAFCAMNVVSAQEFLGIALKDTNKTVLNKKIEDAGGKLLTSQSNAFVYVYVFKNSKIPSAVNAATYWNEKGEWVSLRLGFQHDTYNNQALRKSLVEKYKEPRKGGKDIKWTNSSSAFDGEYFGGKALWEFPEFTIEYDADSFKPKLPSSMDERSSFHSRESYHVLFRHNQRYNTLKDNLQQKIDESNKSKWKGIF